MKTLISNPALRALWALLLLGIAVAAMTGQFANSQPPQGNPAPIDPVSMKDHPKGSPAD